MASSDISNSLSLRSHVTQEGKFELSLAKVPVEKPKPDEVLIRVDAAPINPADIWGMFGTADLKSIHTARHGDRHVAAGQVPADLMRPMLARAGQSIPLGIEGAGLVIDAGSSPQAQALKGRMVAARGDAMYSQYCVVPAHLCLPLPDGATAVDGASASVNPMTSLGFVETMKREGHTALINTAAASNLGQMLLRICLKDGIGLVNIVRKAEQAELLKELGATHVCSTDSDDFDEELTEAIAATGATLGFDATGGGDLANRILVCMESAISRKATKYSRYGSDVHKQVYLYGGLVPGPVVLDRSFGAAWGVGGWLVMNFFRQTGPEVPERLKKRVAEELKTTFASRYTQTLTMEEALSPDVIAAYTKRATGEKFLVAPNKQ